MCGWRGGRGILKLIFNSYAESKYINNTVDLILNTVMNLELLLNAFRIMIGN